MSVEVKIERVARLAHWLWQDGDSSGLKGGHLVITRESHGWAAHLLPYDRKGEYQDAHRVPSESEEHMAKTLDEALERLTDAIAERITD